MANIILINDQDQEQTLTWGSKLVTRSTDGDVEYILGGGGCQCPLGCNKRHHQL